MIVTFNLSIVIWSYKRGDGALAVTLPGWLTFANALELKLYVATDSEELSYANKLMFSKSNWRQEWEEVLGQLKERGVQQFISLLDDFYVLSSPYKFDASLLLTTFKEHELSYLALEPHPSTSSLYDKFIGRRRGLVYRELDRGSLYSSSLRPSLWTLKLFEETLMSATDIWRFENVRLESYKYASICCRKDQIKCVHLLEKGKLNYNIIHLSMRELLFLFRNYNYDFVQILKLPKILLSNLIIKLVGYRFHNVLYNYRNTRI